MACCTLVAVSFVLFARDQLAGASAHQQKAVATSTTLAGPTRIVVKKPSDELQPRQFIDDAAHALTSPFDSFVHSGGEWARHGVPALLALFVYGVGLGYLARWSSGTH
jgi:hypothetical protein